MRVSSEPGPETVNRCYILGVFIDKRALIRWNPLGQTDDCQMISHQATMLDCFAAMIPTDL
ncbi:MAG: hypothetical protein CSA09_04395 [Candidatus Contendobacter odensis]|uniref:Uncharacterized protein n=1 Tax=Candidatus Contendibacter odensensis TaxID=1400860 RepID=A0A2G6PEE2_9GAMM|nr:MAG: hypothetical protein CSA09_04395 [Candidatus Contendobacter odensis]